VINCGWGGVEKGLALFPAQKIPVYLILFLIKDSFFINNRYRIDSLLDWKGYHWALIVLG